MRELKLTTEYGEIPVTAYPTKDERFMVLRDKRGIVNVEFAVEVIEKYQRGEIKKLEA